MGYSIEPRDWIFVKGYELLSFAKNIDKDLGKNISEKLSGNVLIMLKKSATNVIKMPQKVN